MWEAYKQVPMQPLSTFHLPLPVGFGQPVLEQQAGNAGFPLS